MKRVLFFVLTLTAVAPAAAAQVPSTTAPLTRPFLTRCNAEPVLAHLTSSYNQGDWAAFQREARRLLDTLRGVMPEAKDDEPLRECAPTEPLSDPIKATLNHRARHVVLVWIGNDAFGKTQIMRAVVHSRPEPEPFAADLPGTRSLTEVVLASSLDARAVSLYVSTREKDPLEELSVEVIKAIFAPLSATVGGLLGTISGQAKARSVSRETEPSKLTVTIKGGALPFSRAAIQLRMQARDLRPASEFANAVDGLATTLKFDGAGRSDRARAQINRLSDNLPVVASKNCRVPTADDRKEAERAAKCREALDIEIKAAYDDAIKGAPDDEVAVVDNVDKEFRSLAKNGLSTSAELEMTFKNRPPTHFTFGAGSAVAFHATVSRVRTKIDDDTKNLVSDPLPRVLTMAFVNWSPRGYDETSAKISPPERIRGFVGAALTPDFGMVGGANVLLFRGIGVLVGGGQLFGKGAEPDEIGKPPAATDDPFKLARATIWFVGISYNYK